MVLATETLWKMELQRIFVCKGSVHDMTPSVLIFLVFNFLIVVANGDLSTRRCWTLQTGVGVRGATYFRNITSEDECKNQCIANSGSCFGVDWNRNRASGYYGCWLQMSPNLNSYGNSDLNHWSLVNCTATTVAEITTTQSSTTTTTTTTTTATSTSSTTTRSTPGSSISVRNSASDLSISVSVTTPLGNKSLSETATAGGLSGAAQTSIIAGVVAGVGGSLLIALLILAIVLLVRKRRQNKHGETIESRSPDQDIDMNLNPTKADPMTLMELESHFHNINKTKDGLKDEFNRLPSGDTEPCIAAKHSSNKKKNRFKNIWPYEENRIKLPISSNDDNANYINASYIQGYDGSDKSYIATQGPLKETLDDFWCMIWEENVNRIVMLAKLVEEAKVKCERYWPEHVDDRVVFDKITVTLIECHEFTDCTKRVMKIEHEHYDDPRLVTQLQCVIWGDKSVPSEVYTLLAFHSRVRMLDAEATGPMLVHCSAGVGRTGTFVALDILIEQAEKFQRLSVFDVVKKLRLQRMSMVQVADQYRLLYSALMEWNNSGGHTGISRNNFEESFGTATIIENFPDVLKARAEQEFNQLQNIKSSVKDDERSVGNQPQNATKNRKMTTIPADNVRIHLSQAFNQSNYINAALMKGYRWPNYYILTQLPMKHTAGDFWRMIIERKCSTIVVLEPNEVIQEDIYWPTEIRSNLQFGKLSVTLSSKVDVGSISAFEIQLKQTTSSTPQIVHLYQLSSWLREEELPESSKDVLDLIGFVSERQQQVMKSDENSTNIDAHKSPVVVVCFDGAKKCGLLSAASYLTDKMRSEREIDPYLSCRYLLTCRPQGIVSLLQYQYLYQLAAEYCRWIPTTNLEFPTQQLDSRDIYANVQHNNKSEPVYANG